MGWRAVQRRQPRSGLAAEADARVDDRVEHVDEQVDDDEEPRDEDYRPLHHRLIPHLYGVDQQRAETAKTKRVLDEHRTDDEEAEE